MKQTCGSSQADQFTQQLTGCQVWLYAYILGLVGDRDSADDVLQSTNLVLWRKAQEFTPGTDFTAWVCAIARYQVMAYRRDRGRDRHLFDEETLRQLADHGEQLVQSSDARLAAFRACEQKLKPPQRELLRQRYGIEGQGGSIEALAQRRKESPAAIVSSLYRIRRALLNCIRRHIKES